MGKLALCYAASHSQRIIGSSSRELDIQSILNFNLLHPEQVPWNSQEGLPEEARDVEEATKPDLASSCQGDLMVYVFQGEWCAFYGLKNLASLWFTVRMDLASLHMLSNDD
ncbi:hypothetical protein EJB05_28767, partial [Eragrostis curvula]